MISLNKFFAIVSNLWCASALLMFSGQANADYANGTLKVVSDFNYPPYEFKTKNSNQYVGFDIDIINAILNNQGFRAEFVKVPFPKDLSDVVRGNADIAIGAIAINDARKSIVHFSEPYFKSGQAVLVNKALAEKIRSIDDINGTSICTHSSSIANDYIIEHDLSSKTVDFENINDSFMGVLNGTCDIAISDKATLEFFLSHHKDANAFILEEMLTTDQYGIVTSQDRQNVTKVVEEGLRSIKEDGTYDRIYEKWFGSLGFLLFEQDQN